MAKNRVVSLTNVGKISHLDLTLPAEGGMVILRGRNGLGKTTALDTFQSAIDGKGKVNVQDGAEQAEVSFLGVTIKASKKTRHSGCLQVDSLEGRFSVADVIDPGFADPVANDRRAILAILQVVGTKADPSAFYDLVGGEEQFKKFVSKDTLKETDMVNLASKTKRNFEQRAQECEHEVESLQGKLSGLETTLPKKKIEITKPSHEIQKEIEETRRASIQAHTKFEQASQAIKAYEEQEKQFLALRDSANPELKVSQAEEDLKVKTKICEQSGVLVAELRDKLNAAITAEKLAKFSMETASVAHREALVSAENFRKLKSIMDNGYPPEYPEDAVHRADQDLSRLQNELSDAQAAELSKQIQEEVDELKKEIETNTSQAKALRDAAQSVESVLTDMISQICPKLKFEGDRLKMDTDRGPTFFHDTEGTNGLSKGERTKVAIDIAAEAVGEGGVIVLPQDFTQDLDPVAQQDVADHARLRSVTIITAMCTSDPELNAETL